MEALSCFYARDSKMISFAAIISIMIDFVCSFIVVFLNILCFTGEIDG